MELRLGMTGYVATAALVRSADAGAGLALILLAVDPGTDLRHPGAVGGLLAAALTAPHAAGPVLARRLDAARDGRRVLALAFASYAVLLSAAVVLLGRTSLWVVGGCAALAGLCGPLLTGGLSSRLEQVADRAGTDRRRAVGWDAVTYSVAGTAGPALVALVAGLATPLVAALTVAAAALVAAPLALALPASQPRTAEAGPPLTVRATLAAVARVGPLRRVTYTTTAAAFASGGLALLAVALGTRLTDGGGAGATLVAAFGAGNLLASLVLTRWPLRGEPEVLTVRAASLLAAALGLCALAPSFPLAVLAFLAVGSVNAPMFAATLAARGDYAPEGARAQVFVSVAGLKVAAVSAGTALTGAALGAGPRALLAVAAGVVVVTAVAATADRRATTRPRLLTPAA